MTLVEVLTSSNSAHSSAECSAILLLLRKANQPEALQGKQGVQGAYALKSIDVELAGVLTQQEHGEHVTGT